MRRYEKIGVARALLSGTAFGFMLFPAASALAEGLTSDKPSVGKPVSDEPAPGEIVVTAQRREQRLKDVPLSVSVISGNMLKASNFTSITDIQFLSPGVNYNATPGGGFNIRGIGTQSLLVTAEQSVALVVDDVVQGLPELSLAGPSDQAMGDLERIEVLKGPQGTLFGKNSSAGVIQIITKKPKLGEYSGYASVSYASKNEVNSEGAVNLPVGDTLAFRISGDYQRRDGFVKNYYNDEDLWAYDRYNIRAKALWMPTSKLNVLLSVDWRNLDDNGIGEWTLRNCGSGFSTFNACTELAKFGVVASPTNLAGAWEGANFSKQRARTYSARVNYDIGTATLTSITAYRTLYQDFANDSDSTQRPIYSVNHNTVGGKQFTQELRLDGKYSIFHYTAGVFYYDAKPYYIGRNGGTLALEPDSSPILISATSRGPGASSGGAVDIDAETRSWALFGQLEAQLTPHIELIVGGRYTNDDVRMTINYFDLGFICRAAYAFGGTCHTSPFPPAPSRSSTSADKFTYKATLKYNFTDDINAYIGYATGYKGPMISYPANQPELAVRPETAKSWEIGLKTSLFDHKVNFNVDAFKVNYKDFQGQKLIGSPPIQYYTTTNAGALRTKGVEGDITWRATKNLTLSGNYAHILTKFSEFAVQCADAYTNPATIPGECTYIQPGSPAGSVPQFNATGYPLIFSPKNTFSIGASYEHPIGNSMSISANANYNWRSKSYGVAADPNSITPSYGLMNAQLSYGRKDGRWRASVFARNLFDQYFVAGIFRTPLDSGTAGSNPLSTLGYANVPAINSSRTVGIRLDVKFGE